jgi:hypothetical protein
MLVDTAWMKRTQAFVVGLPADGIGLGKTSQHDLFN